MLDIHFLRDHAHAVQAALDQRHTHAPLDQTLALDQKRRGILVELEDLRAQRNRAGKAIGQAKYAEDRNPLIEEQRRVAGLIDALEDELRHMDAELHDHLSLFPNLPLPAVPPGPDASANVVLRQHGDLPAFAFPPRPHWDLGAALGILDMERAAAMSGTRMVILRGLGARLQRALIDYCLEQHAASGYEELYLPAMVRTGAMFASGHLPKFADTLYRDAEEDYFFIPTAEVPITNLHRDEILDEAALPLRYTAHTPCFRREKVSAGRDVRGMKRVHQFEKVEMYQFTTPRQSAAALEEMLGQAEALLRGLGLTYRVVQLCAGDLGFSAALSYDLEVWSPGVGEWMEVASLSTCTDFQARRANIRYRPADGGKPQPVHTLNGSGLPPGRILATILETYQRHDGSVEIPLVLRPRLGGLSSITPG